MREILFRGKTSDGEWICGHLLEQNIPDCRSYIVMSIIAEMDNRHIEIMDFDINHLFMRSLFNPELEYYATAIESDDDSIVTLAKLKRFKEPFFKKI